MHGIHSDGSSSSSEKAGGAALGRGIVDEGVVRDKPCKRDS